tara:strand:+ start:1987 stop:2664 length:678 start_codon:yes stop_codon:yes gene_type:complete
MTPHNRANSTDYAETVLLPGDPLRAKWIAETYFDNPKLVNDVRNCLGYTGTYKGKPISVQAGGMGMPSNSIYITELYKFYNVQTIIRVGSCGGISKDLKVGDIVAATTASTDSNMNKHLGIDYSPTCTWELLKSYTDKYPEVKVGSIMSTDYFYNTNPVWWKEHQRLGTLAVEMETYMLYTLAAQFNKKSLSVCTVADHFEEKEQMTAKERETSFTKMIEGVLEL